MTIIIRLENAIQENELKLNSLKNIIHNNEEELDYFEDYKKLFNKDIKELEEDIAELKGELKIIKARDQKE